jgi:rod shape-determining protein MreC
MLLGFLAISIALIAMDRQSLLDPIRSGLSEIVNPIQSGFNKVIDPDRNQSDVEKELAEVKQERDALMAENANLKADQQELETLRKLQEVKEDNPTFTYSPCNVIGSDPTGTQYWVKIDCGTADGIAKGMAVVDPNNYVGQVTEVKENEAVVTYIIDTSMRVGAKLLTSQSDGVVYGQWNIGGRLKLKNLDKNTQIGENEWVVTADDSSVQTRQVPPNIIIGFVIGEPILNEQTDELEVEVYPAVENFDALQIVYVVRENANP